jgi:hypothetical protein
MRIFYAAAALSFAWISCSALAQSRAAGFVLGYAGLGSDYAIKHAGTRLNAANWLPLYPGDVVDVLKPNGHITISLAGASLKILDRHDAPYTIRAPRSAISRSLANLLIALRSVAKESEADVPLVARGGAEQLRLVLPLPTGVNAIAPGQRSFGASWRGGVPPYRVILQRQDGAVLATENDIDTPELFVASRRISLPDGSYTVTVNDAVGARDQAQIVAGEVPPPPPDLMSSIAAPELESLLRAMWLSRNLSSAYRYEAYLELLPLTRDNRLNATAEAQIHFVQKP